MTGSFFLYSRSKNFFASAMGCACLLLISWGARAQPGEAELLALLPDACTLEGEFEQRKQLAEVPVPLVSTGSFLFSCEHGLIWQTRQPLPEAVVYRKGGGQLRLVDGEEEKLDGRVQREIGALLNDIIGADTHDLLKRFSLSLAGPGVEDGLLLQPENRNLKRFLGSITLKRTDSGMHIRMDSERENTLILITDSRNLDGLTQAACREQWPDSVPACDFLFGP